MTWTKKQFLEFAENTINTGSPTSFRVFRPEKVAPLVEPFDAGAAALIRQIHDAHERYVRANLDLKDHLRRRLEGR